MSSSCYQKKPFLRISHVLSLLSNISYYSRISNILPVIYNWTQYSYASSKLTVHSICVHFTVSFLLIKNKSCDCIRFSLVRVRVRLGEVNKTSVQFSCETHKNFIEKQQAVLISAYVYAGWQKYSVQFSRPLVRYAINKAENN